MKRLLALALLAGVSVPAHGQSKAARARSPFTQTAVLAGGCFWGVEAVFEHTKGVLDVVSGYAGGPAASADYNTVSGGRTRHAESVRITFDPAAITYDQLLKIFFSVVHDPTQLDRQGPDVGPQYRSAVFYANAEQQRAVRAYIAELTSAKMFKGPIVTEVSPFEGFFPAEQEHQDFVAKNPDHPYVVYHDLPKLARLRKEFASIYTRR
jgi:peptide-methionine (S)-S-oxide reductase